MVLKEKKTQPALRIVSSYHTVVPADHLAGEKKDEVTGVKAISVRTLQGQKIAPTPSSDGRSDGIKYPGDDGQINYKIVLFFL